MKSELQLLREEFEHWCAYVADHSNDPAIVRLAKEKLESLLKRAEAEVPSPTEQITAFRRRAK